VRRARTWTELLEQLYEGSWSAELQRFRSPYAFRGLSTATHDLSTSLVRLASGHADIRKLELALVRNFRKYAHDQTESGVDSMWHWLALGQHHGLPTRLVDWTYSPFVALHFATERAHVAGDGIVWCVNFVEANKRLPRRLRLILEEEHSQTFTIDMLGELGSLRAFDALSRRPFVIFLEPPSLDSRILNQFALFSMMPSPQARLDEWLSGQPELCRRVVVPAELKLEVRDKLDQANINERTLFPGLDGLSRWLARYYQPTRTPPAAPDPAAPPGGRRRAKRSRFGPRRD
jgi:hypothetical protein